jgi:hypothetical protein
MGSLSIRSDEILFKRPDGKPVYKV